MEGGGGVIWVCQMMYFWGVNADKTGKALRLHGENIQMWLQLQTHDSHSPIFLHNNRCGGVFQISKQSRQAFGFKNVRLGESPKYNRKGNFWTMDQLGHFWHTIGNPIKCILGGSPSLISAWKIVPLLLRWSICGKSTSFKNKHQPWSWPMH